MVMVVVVVMVVVMVMVVVVWCVMSLIFTLQAMATADGRLEYFRSHAGGGSAACMMMAI